MFDRRTVAAFWACAQRAFRNGLWPALVDMGTPSVVQAEEGALGKMNYTTIPSHEIKSLDGGKYTWRRFETQAENLEEAMLQLNAQWIEQQHRRALAALKLEELKVAQCTLVDEHPTTALGAPFTLRHPRYKPIFRGRLLQEGSSFTFVESQT